MSLFGKSAQELCNDAFALEKQGRYNEAVQSFKKAINDNPKYATAYNGIAWAYAIKNYELEEALGYINKAITFADSQQSQANYIDTRAEILIRLQRIDDAIDDFKKCINLSGGHDKQDINYSASYRLAWCYFVTQNTSTAFSWINEALKKNPQNPSIYATHGDICLNLGQYKTAINSYNKAIENSSGWNFNYPIYGTITTPEQNDMIKSNYLISMGVAFYSVEDYESCLICNKQSYALFKQPTSIINLASLAAKQEDSVSVRDLLEEGIALIDTQIHAHVINALLTEPDLERYRDIVLDLLKNHGKITPLIYAQYKKAWQEKKGEYEQHIKSLQEKPAIHIHSNGGYVFTQPIGTVNKMTSDNKSMGDTITVGRDYVKEGNIIHHGNEVGTVHGNVSFVNELEKIKTELKNAEIDAKFNDEVATIEKHVNEAITLSNNPTPDKEKITAHIEHATDIAKTVSKFVETATPLVGLLIKAGKWIAAL